jgi:hypothetical protein
MNQKMTRSKRKSVKATKSFPETSDQSNVKKRRQTVRRTVQFLLEKKITNISELFYRNLK